MARLTQAQVIQRLYAIADELEPRLAEEFRQAIQDIVSRVGISALAGMIARGDVEGALRALALSDAAFAGLAEVVRQAFIAAGQATIAGLPTVRAPDGAAVVIRFDVRSPRAEEWLRLQSSRMIAGIVESAREAVRAALAEGMIAGRNPRSVAIDVVGRINPTTKRREGGVVGLTAQQAGFVRSARAELLSGDPALLAAYLGRKRRDKRFDRVVSKAIRQGKPVPAEMVAKMVGRYSDRLLDLRGSTIARTEMLGALNAGAREGVEQAIDTGVIARVQVVKRWRDAADRRVRDSHRRLRGEKRLMDERFSNGLLYPHEPSAPASETVMCRCVCSFTVDHLSDLR
jgi:hypothetical protein